MSPRRRQGGKSQCKGKNGCVDRMADISIEPTGFQGPLCFRDGVGGQIWPEAGSRQNADYCRGNKKHR